MSSVSYSSLTMKTASASWISSYRISSSLSSTHGSACSACTRTHVVSVETTARTVAIAISVVGSLDGFEPTTSPRSPR